VTATLPRSALLAAWGTAALTGGASADQARAAVQGSDEQHAVTVSGGAPLGGCDGGSVTALLTELRAAGVRGLRVVLPVPGDVLGLPGPAPLNAEALEAGECVVAVGGPDVALVPEVAEFGSAWEPGAHVTWTVHAATPSAVTDFGSVAEAERHLREAMSDGITALNDLDVARWRDDAADAIDELRHGSGPAGLLPPGTSPRAVRVVDLAWRVRGIAELAADDAGGAVSGWEVGTRAATLRELASVGRRALVAAVNEPVARLR
jgi:hypothetical protein